MESIASESRFLRAFRSLALVGLVVVGLSGCAREESERTGNPQYPGTVIEASVLGKTLGSHDRPVVAVVFTEDGEAVYSADGESLIQAWNVASAKPVLGAGMFRRGRAFAFSRNGEVAVISSRNRLKVLDVKNVRDLKTFEVGLDAVTSFPTYAHLSSDGTKVLIVAWGGNVSLWDLVEGHAIHLIPGRVGAYHARDASAFSPTDSLVLIASSDSSTVEIREVKDGSVLQKISAHLRGTRSSAFSPDGTQIVTVGIDNSFKRWDVESGELLATYDTSRVAGINRVTFSPNRKLMVAGHNDGSITIWSVEAGTLLKRFSAHDGWVETIAISPDGSGLASGGPYGKVKYWTLAEILAD